MKRTVISSVVFLLSMAVLTGIIYPLIVTGAAHLLANHQRVGSPVTHHGNHVGSLLIGQEWTSARYFHGRPSAIMYNPLPSGGSNRSIASAAYRNEIRVFRDSIASLYGVRPTSVPADLVMASASGIDPHISPAAAYLQVNNIISARAWPPTMKARIHSLIEQNTMRPLFGLIGQPSVNVLLLNCALDTLGAS